MKTIKNLLKKGALLVGLLTAIIHLNAQSIDFAKAACQQMATITSDTSVYLAVNTILPDYHGDEKVRVDVVPDKEFCTFMVSDGTWLQNEGHTSYMLYYPIKLENDAVFTHKAFVADDAAVYYLLNKISAKSKRPEKCGVFMVDKECVKFACLSEKDGDIYKTYCPLFGDKNSKVELIKQKVNTLLVVQMWKIKENINTLVVNLLKCYLILLSIQQMREMWY